MSNIIRVQKRENPFVMIDKTGLRDKNLSWKAKGLLAYLISLPDDWKIHERELATHSKDGRDSTRSAMKELIEHGYVVRRQLRGEAGKFAEYETVVYEIPQERDSEAVSTADGFSDHGETDHGETDFGKSENGKSDRTNKDLTNKDLTKKDLTNKDKSPKRKKRVYEPDSLEMRMTHKFESLIQKNDEKFKVINAQSWCDHFRLMMEKDERTPQEIFDAMTFAQSDVFWQSNILSADKLRKQMTTLLIQRKQKESGQTRQSHSRYQESAMKDTPKWVDREAREMRAYEQRRKDELSASVPTDEELQQLLAETRR